MMTKSDEAQIRALIEAQFASLSWSAKREADWPTFLAAFAPGARLYPAARPLRPQSSEDFKARLEHLRADGRLKDFAEDSRGILVLGIGNVAVALAGCEMTENSDGVTRDVSGFLLVKDGDGWRIAAQAWDLVEGFETFDALLSHHGTVTPAHSKDR